MNDVSKRALLRWVHILFGLPIIGYIYGPLEEVQPYAPIFRFVFVPVIVLSGFWMWKGHVVRRFFRKKIRLIRVNS